MQLEYLYLLPIFLLLAYLVFRAKGMPEVSDAEIADAKRFARLLVTEIKLFETYKVERGLASNDLYNSLRDEIEAARTKFKRTRSKLKLQSQFEEALIDILADGQPGKLGNEYLKRFPLTKPSA